MSTDSDLIPVVDYARASADRFKDEHTVSDQQAVNEQTAARLGCRIVARFKDNAKSAAKETVHRDDFEAMLKVLRAGKLPDGTPVMGCIVVADDRLVRRTGDYERFVDAITYEEGRVYADARGFKDLYSEDVQSMGLMGAVISRMEVKKIRRRVRRWHRSRAEQGLPPAGPRPFGWKADRVTLEPAEAALIRDAVEAVIARRSINSIVKEWQAKGIKTPRGNKWIANPVKKMLQNPRLCGWRMIDGEILRDQDGSPVVGSWEPIITPEQWQALQAVFEGRRGKQTVGSGQVLGALPQDHREHTYLLSSILRCGRVLDDGTMCGAKLRVTKKPDRSAHRYYCRAKTNGGCGGLARRGDKIDEFVSELVLRHLEQRALRKRSAQPWPGQSELEQLEKDMQDLRERARKGKVSRSFYFDMVEELEPQIARLRTERQRHLLTAEQAAADMTDIRRRWYSETDADRLDIPQKRAYIRECFHAIVVLPAGKGKGSRGSFNPELIEVVWRED